MSGEDKKRPGHLAVTVIRMDFFSVTAFLCCSYCMLHLFEFVWWCKYDGWFICGGWSTGQRFSAHARHAYRKRVAAFNTRATATVLWSLLLIVHYVVTTIWLLPFVWSRYDTNRNCTFNTFVTHRVQRSIRLHTISYRIYEWWHLIDSLYKNSMADCKSYPIQW